MLGAKVVVAWFVPSGHPALTVQESSKKRWGGGWHYIFKTRDPLPWPFSHFILTFAFSILSCLFPVDIQKIIWLCYQRCCIDERWLIGVENNIYWFLIRPFKTKLLEEGACFLKLHSLWVKGGENFSVLFIISSVKEKNNSVGLSWCVGRGMDFLSSSVCMWKPCRTDTEHEPPSLLSPPRKIRFLCVYLTFLKSLPLTKKEINDF